jgi:hypothetical protein
LLLLVPGREGKRGRKGRRFPVSILLLLYKLLLSADR